MTKPRPTAEKLPDLDKGKAAEAAGDTVAATPCQLTPEEQMALFEKELKENDWGHQPC